MIMTPQKVTIVKNDPSSKVTSVGDYVVGSGNMIIKNLPETDQLKKEKQILQFLSKEE